MSRKILQAAQCRSCRYDVLETFASLAGVTLHPTLRPRNIPFSAPSKPSPTISQPRRHFSVLPRARSDLQDLPKDTSAEAGQDQDALPEPDTPTYASIPWYLEVDAPIPPAASNPMMERQILPQVPSDAPPMLSPILTYLSDTAGLDNLLLLDLRHLDPPPALGANLIMLIGTARSIKHLNVSADRFCRWCRSNYKLRPYADGLLGRNELKIKLRRKARRQKLAQSVGNTLEQTRDDGITTGWVCVNVGAVDEAVMDEAEALDTPETSESMEAEEEEYQNPDEGYIGFGSRSTAPRIVVQMFTEEKRLEMDLEGLWEVRTSRRANKDEKAEAEAEITNPSRDVWGKSRNRKAKGSGSESESASDAVDDSGLMRSTATS